MKVMKVYEDFVLGKDSNHYISFLFGGSGSGKSYAVAEHILLKALDKPVNVWVFRKRQVDLKDSVISLYKELLLNDNIPYRYVGNTMEIHLDNGSTIKFRGLDNPERIKSANKISMVHCEEVTEFFLEDIEQIFLRLRDIDNPPRFFFTCNPCSTSGFVYQCMWDKQSPRYMWNGKDVYYLKTTWRDNYNNLPQTYIDHLISLKTTNPRLYSIYDQGEWTPQGRLVFEPEDYTIQELLIPKGAKFIDGFDSGYIDANAIVSSATWRVPGSRDILYTYKEWCRSETTTDVIAEAMKKQCGSRTVYGDCAARQAIADIQKYGVYNLVPNHKVPGSVLANINQIKTYDWYIDPSCVNLIREVGIYQWKKDKSTGLYLDEPDEGQGETHPNAIPALRYSLEGIGSQISTMKIIKGL